MKITKDSKMLMSCQSRLWDCLCVKHILCNAFLWSCSDILLIQLKNIQWKDYCFNVYHGKCLLLSLYMIGFVHLKQSIHKTQKTLKVSYWYSNHQWAESVTRSWTLDFTAAQISKYFVKIFCPHYMQTETTGLNPVLQLLLLHDIFISTHFWNLCVNTVELLCCYSTLYI